MFKNFGTETIRHFTSDGEETKVVLKGLTIVEQIQLQLVQARDTPDKTSGDIYGFYNNEAIYKFIYEDGALMITRNLPVPVFVEIKREILDIGHSFLAIMSPVNCDCLKEGDEITSASVHFIELVTGQESVCWDIPKEHLPD